MSASRWRDERGLTLPIVALLIGTLVLMTSFAVDLGRQRADRRLAQAGADVVALDMVRVVEGRTLQDVVADPQTVTALNASAARNDFQNNVPPAAPSDAHLPRITGLQWGVITPGGDGDTFEPLYNMVGGDGDQNGEDDRFQVPNAVKITTQRTTDYFFQPGEKGVIRTAIAALPEPTVNLDLGSVGAGFQPNIPNSATLDATVRALNAQLAAHFEATVPNPGSAGFDLVGYRGLAAADVDMRRVAANAGFASPNDMMNSSMTVGQFFDATASALDQQAAEGDPNAANGAAQVRRFRTQMGVDSTNTMQLGDVMKFESGGDDAAAEASMNVLDFLAGGAQVVNGDNFISYQFAPSIPGVASASVDQYTVSGIAHGINMSVGSLPLETNQVRLSIRLQVLPLTGSSAPVTIPLIVEAARAVGSVTDLDCADPVAGSEADIGVVTSGVRVRIGSTGDLTAGTMVVTPGVLVQGGLNLLNSSVFVALGMTPLQLLGFNVNGALTATGEVSALGGSSSHTFTPFQTPVPWQRAPGGTSASMGTTLGSGMSVSLGGVALPAAAQVSLRNQLAYVFNNLGTAVLDPVLKAAGVAIAGADLQAHDMMCDGAGIKLVG
ncbi:MAG: hypothetical protein ACJ739_08165 [Acidimicrobiales bacterium]